MPEGPEVQVVRQTLEAQIKACTILSVDQRYRPLGQLDGLVNEQITGFNRHGKYLIIETTHYQWVVHLRMEGKFYITESPMDSRHVHVVFHLSDGRYLNYHDTRKFGRMVLLDKQVSVADVFHLGPDFLYADGMLFYQAIHHKKTSLKAALLDQSIIAGIGNIYADEICFQAGLDPRSRCCRISKRDAQHLVEATKNIMTTAMAEGGTTIRSYTSSLGVTGRFQQRLQVHNQTHCQHCHGLVKKCRVAGRGTYLCPSCQKRK